MVMTVYPNSAMTKQHTDRKSSYMLVPLLRFVHPDIMTGADCVDAEHKFNVSLGNGQQMISGELWRVENVQGACNKYWVSYRYDLSTASLLYMSSMLMLLQTTA